MTKKEIQNKPYRFIFNKVLFMNMLQKSYHCKDTHIGLSAGQNPTVLILASRRTKQPVLIFKT